MIRVLVTGASGQLGKCIQKIADIYPILEFTFMDSKELDITNKEGVNQVFSSSNFDYCINCAAYTNVEQAEQTPKRAFKINAEGVKNIALTCEEQGVILIHISTDYVFDGEKITPYVVEDETNPINQYGKSKLRGEKYVQEILNNYFIIRTSWLYSEFGNNFYKTIVKKAKTKKILYITDEQIGCPTKAKNLAEYIIEQIILNELDYGIHHYTDGDAMSWYDFAKTILAENRLDSTAKIVKDDNYRSFVKRPKNSVLE